LQRYKKNLISATAKSIFNIALKNYTTNILKKIVKSNSLVNFFVVKKNSATTIKSCGTMSQLYFNLEFKSFGLFQA
jgi:hypothetical protein